MNASIQAEARHERRRVRTREKAAALRKRRCKVMQHCRKLHDAWVARRREHDESGQASVEYMLVGLIMIAMMGALSALWRFVSEGGSSGLIQTNASHSMNDMGGLFDVLMF